MLPQLACSESFTINHLLFYFEGGFIGFLSHPCVEIDSVVKLTSAVKIKIDMIRKGLSLEECHRSMLFDVNRGSFTHVCPSSKKNFVDRQARFVENI